MVDGFVESPGPPTTVINIEFDRNMFTGLLPPNGVWSIDVNGVPKPVFAQSWLSPRDLLLSYSGDTPTVTGVVNLLTSDSGLRAADLTVVVAPQSQVFFP